MKCIVCKKELQNIFEEGHQPMNGLSFKTYGHYGSTYFDPMNGSSLCIAVCDECIEDSLENHFDLVERFGANNERY